MPPLTDTEIKRQKSKRDAAIKMAAIGAGLLKKDMRDPDSFRLESVLVMENAAICYEYRAKNGFGGINVGRAVWNHQRTKFATSEQDGFSAASNKECGGKSGTEYADLVRTVLR